MPNKSYTVIIQIDFNTIDCPGVWLCPKGKAFLKICLFGIADLTKDVDPFFPLVIRERFIFEKNFIGVSSVYELHDKIGRSVISIELLQCPVGSPGCVKLAIFNSLLSDLLHPYSSCFAKPPDTSGIELLFTTCKIFPGIIAPKADIALKVVVSDSHGGGGKPSVRRMPLKSRKGDSKRQQAVCHSKNGLNCDCFSRDREQPREQDQPDFGEGGDGFRTEPSAFSGGNAAYRSSTDKRPKTSQFYPRPPSRLTPDFSGHQGQYRKSKSQKPLQPFPSGNKKLTQKDPKYVEEPDMEWARVNFGVALGPGEYKSDDEDRRTLFSKGWEYVWDGEKGDKTGKRQTILSARRPVIRSIEQNDDDLEEPMSDREAEYYGDDAIRREMEECEKLLHKYKRHDVRDDPELKSKYDNCEKHIEWLSRYGDKTRSSDKLITSTSAEEVFQSTAPRQPAIVPCHGKCCKCKEEEKGRGQELSMEREEQTFRTPRKGIGKASRSREQLSPIDENSEWFPRKKGGYQREVRHNKERFWERERIIQEEDRGSGQARESDESEEPRRNYRDEQERRQRERERRRQQELIRQRKIREQHERMSRQQRDSSSDEGIDESMDDANKRGRPSEAPRKEPPKAERRLFSPERIPKPSADGANSLRPSTTPYSGKRQDQRMLGPPTKTKPTLPQQPKISDVRKPQSVQQRAQSPKKSRSDEGNSPGEDCDCDLCERYQELYNPSSHPCPRFQKGAKKSNRQTPPKNTGIGPRKLIASRRNTNGSTKKSDRKNGECGFFSCDGAIATEAIEDMNAIRKFYYGK